MRLIVQRLDLGQFFIRLKILEISVVGRVQMEQKFPWNISRNGVDGTAREDSTFSNSSQAQLKQKSPVMTYREIDEWLLSNLRIKQKFVGKGYYQFSKMNFYRFPWLEKRGRMG